MSNLLKSPVRSQGRWRPGSLPAHAIVPKLRMDDACVSQESSRARQRERTAEKCVLKQQVGRAAPHRAPLRHGRRNIRRLQLNPEDSG